MSLGLWFIGGFVVGQLLVLVAMMVREGVAVRQRNKEWAEYYAKKIKWSDREGQDERQ